MLAFLFWGRLLYIGGLCGKPHRQTLFHHQNWRSFSSNFVVLCSRCWSESKDPTHPDTKLFFSWSENHPSIDLIVFSPLALPDSLDPHHTSVVVVEKPREEKNPRDTIISHSWFIRFDLLPPVQIDFYPSTALLRLSSSLINRNKSTSDFRVCVSFVNKDQQQTATNVESRAKRFDYT